MTVYAIASLFCFLILNTLVVHGYFQNASHALFPRNVWVRKSLTGQTMLPSVCGMSCALVTQNLDVGGTLTVQVRVRVRVRVRVSPLQILP